MYFLAISLISSLLVGFYIKILKINANKDLFMFIFANYIAAICLSYFLFNIKVENINFDIYDLKLILFTGILLPTIFYFVNKSLKFSGLARTDVFQRLSLIIPIILSFTLFGEEISYKKILVIFISFLSIYLILGFKNNGKKESNIFYLIAVFFGYGIADSLFKLIAANKQASFVVTLFLVFACSAVVSLIYILIFRGKYDIKYFFLGIILGVLNFSNIYFYIKAHQVFSSSPTLVFITMNLGVIIGGTLIGRFFFKEKIFKTTLIGILFAIFAIILLALIQLKIF